MTSVVRAVVGHRSISGANAAVSVAVSRSARLTNFLPCTQLTSGFRHCQSPTLTLIVSPCRADLSEPGPTRPTRPRRAGAATCPGAARPANTARRNPAANCASTGGSAWSMCAPTTVPGTIIKACRRRRCEQELRSDTAWQRPSWPLGRLGSAAWEDEVLRDPLHILASGGINTGKAAGTRGVTRNARRFARTVEHVGFDLADHAGRGEDAL